MKAIDYSILFILLFLPHIVMAQTTTINAKIDSIKAKEKAKIDSLKTIRDSMKVDRDSALKRVETLQEKLNSIESELNLLMVNSSERASHTLFLELLGAGGLGSINYDYRFDRNWSWRMGLGYFNWYGSYDIYALGTGSYVYNGGTAPIETRFYGSITLPIMVNYFTDESGSPGHFEIGLGIVPWFGETIASQYIRTTDPTGRPIGVVNKILSWKSDLAIYFPFNVAYRYQAVESGFHFRIGFMPLIGGSFGFLPWGSIVLGWSF